MKKAKFQKITAFLLAAMMIIGSMAMGVSAAGGDSSITDITTSDIKELLNAISYNEYVENNRDVKAADEELVLSATDGWTYVSKQGVVYNENGSCRIGDFVIHYVVKTLTVDFVEKYNRLCRAFRFRRDFKRVHLIKRVVGEVCPDADKFFGKGLRRVFANLQAYACFYCFHKRF